MKNAAKKFLTLINCNYLNKILIFFMARLLFIIFDIGEIKFLSRDIDRTFNLLSGKSVQLM